MTAPSEFEYECNYQIAGLGESPAHCGNRAMVLVVWPPEVTSQTTMTYCGVHYRAVRHLLDRAVEVTDLVPDEC